MSDEEAESNSVSPILKADWFNSRWGREDQRGNGNLMTRDKVLEAVKLIKTGEIESNHGVVGRSGSVWLIVAIVLAVKNLPGGERRSSYRHGTRPNILDIRFIC
jgi:hypothetical protein